MSRSTRTLLVVLIAVATAGLASFGVYRAIQQIPVREIEVRSVQAVVASHSLPVGTRLAPDHVKTVPWPASSPVPDGFSSVEAVLDRGLIAPVGAHEPLTESKLAPREAGAGLPPSIPPGMRAISVKVNEVIGVAGFVVPGTRVDVMVTIKHERESMSRVVVSNVQVLTAGTRYDQEQARDGTPIPSRVVTLMVLPEDAERVALAASEGQIILALRNPLDTLPTETDGVRTSALLRSRTTPPPAPQQVRGQTVMKPAPQPAAAAPAPRIYTVEAIRAAKRTEEVVR